MKIRKQVYQLTPADFEQCPVWEFALDEETEPGQDEATVRPWDLEGPLDPAAGMYAVAASFELADGTRMAGYLTPPVDESEGIEITQPTIVTDSAQVMFWYGILEPTREALERCYQELGRTSDRVFPLTYRSSVELLGGPASGTIDGFMFRHEEKRGFFRKRVRQVRVVC